MFQTSCSSSEGGWTFCDIANQVNGTIVDISKMMFVTSFVLGIMAFIIALNEVFEFFCTIHTVERGGLAFFTVVLIGAILSLIAFSTL